MLLCFLLFSSSSFGIFPSSCSFSFSSSLLLVPSLTGSHDEEEETMVDLEEGILLEKEV